MAGPQSTPGIAMTDFELAKCVTPISLQVAIIWMAFSCNFRTSDISPAPICSSNFVYKGAAHEIDEIYHTFRLYYRAILTGACWASQTGFAGLRDIPIMAGYGGLCLFQHSILRHAPPPSRVGAGPMPLTRQLSAMTPLRPLGKRMSFCMHFPLSRGSLSEPLERSFSSKN